MTADRWAEAGRRWESAGYHAGGRGPGRMIAVILLVIGLLIGGIWAFRWYTADTRGALDARDQILADGDFRIAAYTQFFADCSGIQAQEVRANTFQRGVDRGDPLAPTNLDAVLVIRGQLAADYNAAASAEWTVGQFRAEDLPYQIDLAWLPGEEGTQCASATTSTS